jgi:hypothetical protein
MRIPPRKLLIVENAIRASRPGTAATRATVPRRSVREEPSADRTERASGIDSVARCTITAAVSESATRSTDSMPDIPIRRPLITDVTRNASPVTVPTIPLARSRSGSGTSSVTTVDIAMPRMLPTITPLMSSSTNPHSTGPAGSRNGSGPAAR